MKKYYNIILFFCAGVLGGILGEIFLMPYLIQIKWIENQLNRTVIINKTERVVVEENQAIEETINKIFSSLVKISAKSKGKIKGLANYSFPGLIITSDGYFVGYTDNAINYNYSVTIDEKEIALMPTKIDAPNHLVMFKADASNLSVASLEKKESLALGESLVGVSYIVDKLTADIGIIGQISEKSILVNTSLKNSMPNGAILLNQKGEAVGILSIGGEILDEKIIRALLIK